MAAAVDTLHKDMTFHATGIDPVTVPNEVFGWQIDQEAEIAQLTSELQLSLIHIFSGPVPCAAGHRPAS